MTKTASFLMGVALLATAALATPAAAKSMWGGLNAGIGFPIGDFSDRAASGWGMGVTFDRMLNEQVAWGGELGVFSFPGTDDFEKQHGNYRERIVPFTAHGKYLLPSEGRIKPFVKGAVGMYDVRGTIETATETDSRSSARLGLAVGAGATLGGTSTFAWGVDLMYHYISTSNAATAMITLRAQALFKLSGK